MSVVEPMESRPSPYLPAARGPAGVPSDADGSDGHPRLNEHRIALLEAAPLTPDADATYAADLWLDLATVTQQVSDMTRQFDQLHKDLARLRQEFRDLEAKFQNKPPTRHCPACGAIYRGKEREGLRKCIRGCKGVF